MGLIETGVVDVQVPDWLLVGVAYQGSCANGPARPDPPRMNHSSQPAGRGLLVTTNRCGIYAHSLAIDPSTMMR